MDGRRRAVGETLNGVFAQRSNLLSFPFLVDAARHDALQPAMPRRPRGRPAGGPERSATICAARGYSQRLLSRLSGADGGCDLVDAGRPDAGFSGREFRRLFRQSRLLHDERPVWRTVDGGSRALCREAQPPLFGIASGYGAAVTAIERGRDGVMVTDSLGHTDSYDQVVIAAHSDQALAMLRDASDGRARSAGRHPLSSERGLSASRYRA